LSPPFKRFTQQGIAAAQFLEVIGGVGRTGESSHKIAEAARYGNSLLVAVLINGRKSDALDLTYDPKSGQLSFAPPGVSLYLGP
jgi:hypothetical protein